jgi:hypothetical protein
MRSAHILGRGMLLVVEDVNGPLAWNYIVRGNTVFELVPHVTMLALLKVAFVTVSPTISSPENNSLALALRIFQSSEIVKAAAVITRR